MRIEHDLALSCNKWILASICFTSHPTSNQGPEEYHSKLRNSHNLYNQVGFQVATQLMLCSRLQTSWDSLFCWKKNWVQSKEQILLFRVLTSMTRSQELFYKVLTALKIVRNLFVFIGDTCWWVLNPHPHLSPFS